jgi:JmjC domain, hydroxylase
MDCSPPIDCGTCLLNLLLPTSSLLAGFVLVELHCSSRPVLLQATMLSPRVLARAGIPVHQVVQEAGELVVTFPSAYHANLDTGMARQTQLEATKTTKKVCSKGCWFHPSLDEAVRAGCGSPGWSRLCKSNRAEQPHTR